MTRQALYMLSLGALSLLLLPASVQGFGLPQLATSLPPALDLDTIATSSSAWITSASDAVAAWTTTSSSSSPLLSGSPDLTIDLASSSSSLLTNLVQGYQQALHAQALQTQVITGVVLAILGDALAQNTISKEPNGYNVKRALSFATFDAVYRAAQHYIYPPMMTLCAGQVLGPLVPNHALAAAAMERALVSQIVVIPIVYYPVFFAVTGAVQGLTTQQTVQRAQSSFWPLMKRNWLFWIPVQFGVFAGVSDEAAQIVILTACGLVWTIILSILAGQVNATPTTTTTTMTATTEPEPVLAVEMVQASLLQSYNVSLGDASIMMRSSEGAYQVQQSQPLERR